MERRVAVEKATSRECSFTPHLVSTQTGWAVSRSSLGGSSGPRRSSSAPPRDRARASNSELDDGSSKHSVLEAADAAVKAVAELTQRMALGGGAETRSRYSSGASRGKEVHQEMTTSAGPRAATGQQGAALYRNMRSDLYIQAPASKSTVGSHAHQPQMQTKHPSGESRTVADGRRRGGRDVSQLYYRR